MEIEPIQIMTSEGVKLVYKAKSLLDFVDKTINVEPLDNVIEGFNIPILQVKGLQFKNRIRYVAMRDVYKALDKERDMFTYPLSKIDLIYPLEVITKRDYKAQIICRTEFYKSVGRPTLKIISLEDLIQCLQIIQSRPQNTELVRKLLLKIIELKKQLDQNIKERVQFLINLLHKLDDIAFEFICNNENKWNGYQKLWDSPIWDSIIYVHREKNKLLGLTVPPRRHTGLHHPDKYKPYRLIYPHIATKGHLIDKRYDHDDHRNKKFY